MNKNWLGSASKYVCVGQPYQKHPRHAVCARGYRFVSDSSLFDAICWCCVQIADCGLLKPVAVAEEVYQATANDAKASGAVDSLVRHISMLQAAIRYLLSLLESAVEQTGGGESGSAVPKRASRTAVSIYGVVVVVHGRTPRRRLGARSGICRLLERLRVAQAPWSRGTAAASPSRPRT